MKGDSHLPTEVPSLISGFKTTLEIVVTHFLYIKDRHSQWLKIVKTVATYKLKSQVYGLS